MTPAGRGADPGLRLFAGVLASLTVLHVLLAMVVPVSGDEAYYWECSRHLDWSYFDQPPLVIWAMVPFRAVLGETALAVRAPAILASLVCGLVLLPLARRLGGGPREAGLAYLWLHGTPLFFIGSFYASTDIVMTAAYTAAAAALVAIADGDGRAWWPLGVAVGIGFLAKFPVVLVLAALVPVLARRPRQELATARPWLAGALAAALTMPVWIWAVQHDWANIVFQLTGRHGSHGLTLRYLGEFVGANLLLATPALAVAAALAWRRGWRRPQPGWAPLLVAATTPLAFFALFSLRSRVGAHWAGPGLVVAMLALALIDFRWRRVLVATGMILGLGLCAAAIGVVAAADRLVDAEWSYRGRPHRISTRKLAAVIGNDELLGEVVARSRPGELVASESYSTAHLLAFLSGGQVESLLAHVKPGKHGLASLYWRRPAELRGRDVLFVTEKRQVDARLAEVFAEVEEEAPLILRRGGRVVRTVRFLRCRDLKHPEGVFTRLDDE